MKLLTVAVPVVIVALMLAALGGVSGVTNETRSVERAPASAQQTLVACVPPEAMNGGCRHPHDLSPVSSQLHQPVRSAGRPLADGVLRAARRRRRLTAAGGEGGDPPWAGRASINVAGWGSRIRARSASNVRRAAFYRLTSI